MNSPLCTGNVIRDALVMMLLGASMILAPTGIAHANRALLIGVGTYNKASPLPNLPGIDVDLENMRQVASILGFGTDQVRVLENEAATADAIRQEIHNWLIKGSTRGDRVLLYYSGHGSRVRDRGVRDEIDGWDEVITGYDLRLASVRGAPYATGVVLDDELYALLSQLKGREVWVIIDACSSGTATRTGEMKSSSSGWPDSLGWVRKSGDLEGAPDVSPGPQAVRAVWHARKANQNWVSLAAAEDDQSAISTPYGSLFTQALHTEVLAARDASRPVSIEGLHASLQQRLTQRMGNEPWVPQPVLHGPDAKVQKGIQLTSPGHTAPVRRQLEKLETRSIGPLLVASRQRYVYGDEVHLSVEVPGDGYLNVVAVDSLDRARLLFPNAWHPENRVHGPQTLVLGEPALGFRLEAGAPHGESYVIAIYTDRQRPLNFYRDALAEFGEVEGVQRGLAKLSSAAVLYAKGIRVTAPLPSYQAQGIRIGVTAK